MSARLLGETMLTLAQAASLLPNRSTGKPVGHDCLWRWINTGVLLADGSTVLLEGAKIGGRWYTSEEALGRFVEATTPKRGGSKGGVPSGRPSAAARAAGRELDSLGIGSGPNRAA